MSVPEWWLTSETNDGADTFANAFDTWDAGLPFASDKCDGWPDTAIVPLVQLLRAKGIVTLQSCAGHAGSSDGTLWIDARTVSDESVAKLVGPLFDFVRRAVWPHPRWEFIWPVGSTPQVLVAFGTLEPRSEAPHA